MRNRYRHEVHRLVKAFQDCCSVELSFHKLGCSWLGNKADAVARPITNRRSIFTPFACVAEHEVEAGDADETVSDVGPFPHLFAAAMCRPGRTRCHPDLVTFQVFQVPVAVCMYPSGRS